jgi:hypothetical protein
VEDYYWDYKKSNNDITQLEHNETLNNFLLCYMKEFNLDVIITSPLICGVFENFGNFHIIGRDDVYNYKRYKSDVSHDFEPFFLIIEDENNIGVVIKSNIRVETNNIIITNTNCSDIKIIDIWNLPTIKLINCFKN